MNNVNENKENSIKLIKNFIQDLSFENTENIIKHNLKNSHIGDSMNVIFKAYDKNLFSLILKYNLDCSFIENKKKLFILELDYFGSFEISGSNNHNQKTLTEKGSKLLFPFVKDIVEIITKKGGVVPVLLKEPDFSLRKI